MAWSDTIISLLPVSLLITLIVLAVRPTFFRRFFAKIRENPIYKKERTLITDRPLPRFTLPYVVIIWCVLPIVGIICAPLVADFFAKNQGDQLTQTLFGFEKLTVALVGIAVVIIHLRPNHSRELKYTLLIGALPAVALFIFGPITLGASILVFNENPIRFLLLIQLLSLWPVYAFVVASWSISYWARTWDVAQSSSSIGLYVFSFFRYARSVQ